MRCTFTDLVLQLLKSSVSVWLFDTHTHICWRAHSYSTWNSQWSARSATNFNLIFVLYSTFFTFMFKRKHLIFWNIFSFRTHFYAEHLMYKKTWIKVRLSSVKFAYAKLLFKNARSWFHCALPVCSFISLFALFYACVCVWNFYSRRNFS